MYDAVDNTLFHIDLLFIPEVNNNKHTGCIIIVCSNIKGNDHTVIPFKSAQNRIRTCTSLRTLPPEGSASTNFAIWAFSLESVVINS